MKMFGWQPAFKNTAEEVGLELADILRARQVWPLNSCLEVSAPGAERRLLPGTY